MELRHLRYFIAVAEDLNFSRAATRLQMAQPPLSQQIQALEAELGVVLFDRKKRPLQLTRAGVAFLDSAIATLAQLEQSVQQVQRIHQGGLGHLSIGFTSAMANGLLPQILRQFSQRYPDVKLLLREETSRLQIQGLRDRTTDIIFTYQNVPRESAQDLRQVTLLQEALVVVLPQTHRFAHHDKISLGDLAQEAFIMPQRQLASPLSEQIIAHCTQAGFVPQVVQEAVFMVTILGLVAGEMGISLLPVSVQNLQRQGVVYRPLQKAALINPLRALWRSEDESAVLAQFIAQATAIAREPLL
jgi:DNA-binding transcriptional LysR family regulator